MTPAGLENKTIRMTRPGAGGLLVAFMLFSLSACGSLAPVKPVPPTVHEDVARYCRASFPEHPRQFIHSLTAYLPGDEISNAIGVINIYPETGKVKCVIMGVEGVVLFNGEYDRKPVIHKAVPPLDSMKFAGALFEDIRLAFLPPAGQVVRTGILPSGTPACRYKLDNGGYIDLLFPEEGRLEIKQYSRWKRPLRTIDARYAGRSGPMLSENEAGVPVKLEIIRHGILTYRLELVLLKTEVLTPE